MTMLWVYGIGNKGFVGDFNFYFFKAHDYGGLIGMIMKTLNLQSWVELPDPPPISRCEAPIIHGRYWSIPLGFKQI